MKADERTGILYEEWKATSARAVLLLVHGLGAHSGRWEFLSRFFLENNISSYAIELRGFGLTGDLKGYVDSFRIYLEDICALRDVIRKEHPGCPVFILGESLGGLLCFLLAFRNPGLFNGLICLSPAFKSKLKFSLSGYIKFFRSLLFNPQEQIAVPFASWMCTRDTNYQVVIDNDPREHRLASAKLLFNTLIAQRRAASLKNALTTPVLFLLAEKDLLVDVKMSVDVFNRLNAADKTIIRYPDMYHALSIDLGKEKVFADILKWINRRLL